MEKLYRKCWKCGNIVQIEFAGEYHAPICTTSAPWRTSGICAGSYSVEVKEEDFLKYKKEYEERIP